jgi:hypothetical protein
MARNAATSVPLDEGSFRDVLGQIVARPEESRWREIPWQTDIRDACRIAAETGKPIFLWAMNGNPLGCT